MCMGLPMRVIKGGFGSALCQFGDERRQIDTMLVGEQQPGAWLLVFIDAAREVISDDDARKINDALASLRSVMNGGDGDVETLFADIVENSPASRKEAM